MERSGGKMRSERKVGWLKFSPVAMGGSLDFILVAVGSHGRILNRGVAFKAIFATVCRRG